MSNKYTDQTLQGDAYEVLPVPSFNKIFWRSGDSRLSPLLGTDPGQYLGEFRSMTKMPATKDREEIILPVLPWKIVTRKAGRESYTRYSATEMSFRPIRARLRYVLFQRDSQGIKAKDANGRDVILSITKTFVKGSGFTPQKEVFGMVFDDAGVFSTYALLSIDAWSSFISYDRAVKEYEKIAVPDGQLVVYRIGTRGITLNTGEVVPKTRTFGGGESVDIEALDLDNPYFMDITDDFDNIWNAAEKWSSCKKWNAETAKAKEAPVTSIGEVDMNTVLEVSDNFPHGTPGDDEYPA